MANLTFADLQNEVYAHTGLDSATTANQTNVNRWLNYSQQDICSAWPWSFMRGREVVTTVPDYTTGTVSITAGGTTVTGSGTTFTSQMATTGQYFIQFSTANDWYHISAYTSATSITIDAPYNPTTNLSGGAFIIRRFYYSLSSTADRIIDIRIWNTPIKLIEADVRTLDDFRPNPQSTNSPYGYVTFGYDTGGNIQISPYPFPSDARLMEIRIAKRPVDMVSSTDAPSIPNKYAHVIAWGATAVGFAYKGKEWLGQAQAWNAKYEEKIDDMKRQDRQSQDYQPVLRSIDSGRPSARWQSLPEQYPQIT